MPHPLVIQLRFTRTEFVRGLKGLTDEEARQRFMPMNSISWNIGHLAWQEQRYFLRFVTGDFLLPEINKQFANGAEACTPPLDEMLDVWKQITTAADPWLDTITTEMLQGEVGKGWRKGLLWGSLVQRVIYHYWYHNGENQAIRQMLGHTKLPQFVGDLDDKAPYLAE